MRRERPGLAQVIRAFVLVLLAGLVLTGCMEWSHRRQERDRMGYIASGIGAEMYEFLLSEMSKTRVLEAYLIQTDGDYSDFGRVAHVLLREAYVRNVLFAPDGIVAGVYPLEGNEAVIGLNMYDDGAGNLEARAAIEKKELYIAGPFELIQGGLGIAGRLPVFLTDAAGSSYFWGIVSVTLDFPQALAGNSLDRINEQGFACQIWRINPDDGQKQVILESERPLPEGTFLNLNLPNAQRGTPVPFAAAPLSWFTYAEEFVEGDGQGEERIFTPRYSADKRARAGYYDRDLVAQGYAALTPVSWDATALPALAQGLEIARRLG